MHGERLAGFDATPGLSNEASGHPAGQILGSFPAANIDDNGENTFGKANFGDDTLGEDFDHGDDR